MTKHLKFLAALLFLLGGTPALAGDANGYTAAYECRAGNPNCNVDVIGLAQQACQQIISPSTPWSSINWNNNVICIEAGDHSSKGVLTVRANGSASNRKVLRYHSSSDNNDEPWNQSNRAKIKKLDLLGASYWLIHRLTVDGDAASQNGVFIQQGSNNNILNRVLVEDHHGYQVIADWNGVSSFNRIQNSVIRKAVLDIVFEAECIDVQKSHFFYFVNNEIYDCHKSFSVGSGVADTRGLVVENNDIYVSTSWYTDCNGNFNGTGPCSGSEAVMSIKAGGISSDPARYFQNRIWGGRPGDGTLIGGASTGGGDGISISGSGPDNPALTADYVLFQRNIVADSQWGIAGYWGPDKHNSIIGNIVYQIRKFHPSWDSIAIWLSSKQNTEVYLNTIIDSYKWAEITGSDFSGGLDLNNDIKCNAVISGGLRQGTVGSGTQIDSNVFYETSPYGTNTISPTVRTRANSTAYSVGDVIVTSSSSNCTNASSAACFMYKVTKAGTAAPSPPPFCTTIGCTTADDGTIIVEAIRGPFSYRRKLRTISGGELAVIPYARVGSTAPEANACPSTFSARTGIGINDQ